MRPVTGWLYSHHIAVNIQLHLIGKIIDMLIKLFPTHKERSSDLINDRHSAGVERIILELGNLPPAVFKHCQFLFRRSSREKTTML